MKQILQNLRTGETVVEEVPAPGISHGCILIQTRRSLISAGTERILIEFGKASLLSKARSQPDKVKQVLDKIKTDGLIPTLESVFKRLDEPLPLGYCNSGVVLGVGAGVTEYKTGDRVVSNGPHSEIVCVPKNLCAKIPDGVTDEQAAFTVLSSIGLQGIRLLKPEMGEKFVVYGLGLIGIVCVRLLVNSGCDVLGIDINPDRLRLAEASGARTFLPIACADPITTARTWTGGKGVDGVLITASSKNDDIIHQSAQMCRKRGRIVLVGVVNMNLIRNDFYEKELSFQVSCSYGPGRYDDRYEQAGYDYPFGFVRWTEQRNFDAILNALLTRRLVVDDLITDRFFLNNAPEAYNKISKDSNALGIILQYPVEVNISSKVSIIEGSIPPSGEPVLGVIGAGNFSKMTMMPALAETGSTIAYIADLNGAAAKHLAGKYNVRFATSNYKEILSDGSVNGILIAIRHNLHAPFVIEALQAGKHVFVEKPLAMNAAEVEEILAIARKHPEQMIMVGFNRRFSSHIVKAKELLASRSEQLCMNIIVNAGYSPPDSWVHHPETGGGRIIGEGCHFMDLMVYLAGCKIRTVSATMVGEGVAVRDDKMSITMAFEDGSIGTINYFANGSKSYPKELLQVFSDGRVLEINNFRHTTGYGFKGFKKFKTLRQDKGHESEFSAFAERIKTGGQSLIPLDELVNVSLASFAAMKSATENRTIVLSQEFSGVLSSYES